MWEMKLRSVGATGFSRDVFIIWQRVCSRIGEAMPPKPVSSQPRSKLLGGRKCGEFFVLSGKLRGFYWGESRLVGHSLYFPTTSLSSPIPGRETLGLGF